MSLTITINLPDIAQGGDEGVSREALDRHMSALGFEREANPDKTIAIGEKITEARAAVMAHEGAVSAEIKNVPGTVTTIGVRERGKPAPGRARRTKEEIAEDEAADKADAASGTTQSISTGGERVGPEDDAETQAADRADEEAEEGQTEAAPLTVIDGKNAMGDYVTKFGIEAATADGMSIFVSALGEPPAGVKGWGWTMIHNEGDQAKIDKVVKAWRAAAAASGRFGA